MTSLLWLQNSIDQAVSQVYVQNFFFGGGGWQVVSLGGGVTVMEKREILVGWVTKVCLKCTKSWGREGGRVTFDNIFKSS